MNWKEIAAEINKMPADENEGRFVKGQAIVAKYGFNDVLKKPFEFCYDFGCEGQTGKYIVYVHGECNMQDSLAFDLDQLRPATEADIETLGWGGWRL